MGSVFSHEHWHSLAALIQTEREETGADGVYEARHDCIACREQTVIQLCHASSSNDEAKGVFSILAVL